MSRIGAVTRREFTEMVRSKSFVIGTVLGPLLIVGFFAMQFFILSSAGGGTHDIVIVDGTDATIGAQIEAILESETPQRTDGSAPSYRIETQAATGDWTAQQQNLRGRVLAEEIDGYLWLPQGVFDSERPVYEGENATNSAVISELRATVQQSVQSARLARAGIDEQAVGAALQPVRLESSKISARGSSGSAEAALVLGMLMSFAIYLAVLLYGASVMNGVLEEKRDKIVELILSSVRAQDLLFGKVFGIGGAGLLQMTVWVGVAALVISYGSAIAGLFGADAATLQRLAETPLVSGVPRSAGILFLIFFAGGFLIYSSLYAALGAITNNAQEAQQFVFPLIMPLVIGLMIALTSVENSESAMVVVASMIPLTSPLVMPVRATIAGVPPVEIALSIAFLALGVGLIVWMAGKIYRVGILSSGKRPTMRQLWRWLRMA